MTPPFSNDQAMTATPGKAPRVSVVVCCYNVAAYLERCVDSLLAQRCQDIEIILVDDGSTDRTPSIVSDYVARDPQRIRSISHAQNQGIGAARNNGWQHAAGDYVTSVDADDWVGPDYLAERLAIAEAAQLNIVFGGYTRVSPDGTEISRSVPPPELLGTLCAGYEYIEKSRAHGRFHEMVWLGLFRRDFLRAGGLEFSPRLRAHDDTEFIYRAVALGSRVMLADVDDYFYRENPASVTRATPPYREVLSRVQAADSLRRFAAAAPLHPRATALIDRQIEHLCFSAACNIRHLEPGDRQRVLATLAESGVAAYLTTRASTPHRRAKAWLLGRLPGLYVRIMR